MRTFHGIILDTSEYRKAGVMRVASGSGSPMNRESFDAAVVACNNPSTSKQCERHRHHTAIRSTR
jgi:hypothetical protein